MASRETPGPRREPRKPLERSARSQEARRRRGESRDSSALATSPRQRRWVSAGCKGQTRGRSLRLGAFPGRLLERSKVRGSSLPVRLAPSTASPQRRRSLRAPHKRKHKQKQPKANFASRDFLQREGLASRASYCGDDEAREEEVSATATQRRHGVGAIQTRVSSTRFTKTRVFVELHGRAGPTPRLRRPAPPAVCSTPGRVVISSRAARHGGRAEESAAIRKSQCFLASILFALNSSGFILTPSARFPSNRKSGCTRCGGEKLSPHVSRPPP